MGLIAADYLRQLQALLPLGLAWPRESQATLTRYLDAASEEFARIDARAGQLIDEADPRTTSELLTDWERVAGLPDNCSNILQPTLQGRRQDLVSKLTATGGQTIAYFIAISAALGYVITIEECKPFRVGASCVGTPLYSADWIFAWRVQAPEVAITEFRAGLSCVGEALRSWGNESLECRIRQLKPAHTIPLFTYGTSEPTVLLDQLNLALLNQDDMPILLEES